MDLTTAVPTRVTESARGAGRLRIRHGLARVGHALSLVTVSIGYVAIVAGTSLVLDRLAPSARTAVIDHVSTNLDNLEHGHIATVLVSAFFADDDSVWTWLPFFAALLVAGELAFGSRRLLATLLTGNVVATGLVAIGLSVAVGMAWMPAAVSEAEDVGVSYGAAAVVGVLAVTLPRLVRGTWICGWSAAVVAGLCSAPSFTAVGHMVALATGFGLAVWFARRGVQPRAGWIRYPFIAGGAVFAGGIFVTIGLPDLTVTAVGAAVGAVLDLALSLSRSRARTTDRLGPPASS